MQHILPLLTICFITVQPVCSEDWPQWGGTAQRNFVSPETGLPSKFEPGIRIRRHGRVTFDPTSGRNVKWVAQLGSRTYSSPAIADGRVFIGTNDDVVADDPTDDRFERTGGGVLRCLRESDGGLLWQLVVPRLNVDRSRVSDDFDALSLGICSTPTVDRDRVYVVSNRCEVLCLDVKGMADGNDGPFKNEALFCSDGVLVPLRATDGDILWRFDMLREIPNFPHDAANCSILVHGECLYVGTSNGVSHRRVVVPEAPSLIVLQKHTGELLARDDTFITPNVLHGQWSSPSLGYVGDRSLVLYGGGDGRCYAFGALTGKPTGSRFLNEVWSFDANPARYRDVCPTTDDYWDLAAGGRKGRFPEGQVVTPSEIIGTPVLWEDRVYVTVGQDPMHGFGSGALSCFAAGGYGDITESGCLWRYTDIGRSMATVSIVDDLLYVSETAGRVHCLDARSGQLRGAFELGEDTWASTLVADNKIYIGHRQGLSVLSTGPQLKHLYELKLFTRVPSAAVAANGVLYVTSRNNLIAFQEKGEMPE